MDILRKRYPLRGWQQYLLIFTINLIIGWLIINLIFRPRIIHQQILVHTIQRHQMILTQQQQKLQNLPHLYHQQQHDCIPLRSVTSHKAIKDNMVSLANTHHLNHLTVTTVKLKHAPYPVMTLQANGLPLDCYNFLKVLSLKAPQLIWQKLLLRPKQSSIHMTLIVTNPIPQSLLTRLCHSTQQSPATPHQPNHFPNQLLESLHIDGYFQTKGSPLLLVSDKFGHLAPVHLGEFVAAEHIPMEVLLKRTLSH